MTDTNVDGMNWAEELRRIPADDHEAKYKHHCAMPRFRGDPPTAYFDGEAWRPVPTPIECERYARYTECACGGTISPSHECVDLAASKYTMRFKCDICGRPEGETHPPKPWPTELSSATDRLLDTTSLTPAKPAPRVGYAVFVSNDEIEAMGPNPTWDDWKAMFLSKEVPPMRLVEGADFKARETKYGVEIEFP